VEKFLLTILYSDQCLLLANKLWTTQSSLLSSTVNPRSSRRRRRNARILAPRTTGATLTSNPGSKLKRVWRTKPSWMKRTS
jgi:hypothetical protein